jgi:hypothetical protein
MAVKNKETKVQIREPISDELEPPEPPEETQEDKALLDRAFASVKLVNVMYLTPEDRMSELTIIPRRLVMRFACMVCKIAAIDGGRDPITQPIARIFMLAVYRLMRSVDGFHLARAGELALSQMRPEEEEEIESHSG